MLIVIKIKMLDVMLNTPFKIKLKTKAGNDLKEKVKIYVFFDCKLKYEGLTKKTFGYYNFYIRYQDKDKKDKIFDTKTVYQIENQDLKTREDLVCMTMLNLLNIVIKICNKENITPDWIHFTSPACRVSWPIFIEIDRKRSINNIKSNLARRLKLNVKNFQINTSLDFQQLFEDFLDQNPGTKIKLSFDYDYTGIPAGATIIKKLLERRLLGKEE